MKANTSNNSPLEGSIELTPEFVAQFKQQVAARRKMRAKIDVAWRQSERGEGRDGEVAFAEIRKRLVSKHRGSKSGSKSRKRG